MSTGASNKTQMLSGFYPTENKTGLMKAWQTKINLERDGQKLSLE